MSFTIRKPLDVILPSGTAVVMETVSTIDSKEATVGQVVDFRIKSDIKVGDKIVIAAGSIAKGQIVRTQHSKAIGKEGYVEVQIRSVTAVDGQEVFLSNSNLYKEGDNKQTLSIVLGVLVCVLFLLLKGKNAVVEPGYQVTASVATNTTIKIAE
ncbi:MAG: hypothetical protein JKY70_16725 [Mucilaginibacter sp.]|nr:hypothetical protein [Mucilaginibacter sp.]